MDDFLYMHVKMNYPNLMIEENIEEVIEMNDYDLLVKFKDGNTIIFDTFSNQYRYIEYNEELTDEQWAYEFGKRLKNIMMRHRITQEEVAERLGTTQAMISKYIHGQVVPSARVVDKLAKILNCSVDSFFYKHY